MDNTESQATINQKSISVYYNYKTNVTRKVADSIKKTKQTEFNKPWNVHTDYSIWKSIFLN